jgi:hypothetical protein
MHDGVTVAAYRQQQSSESPITPKSGASQIELPEEK